MITMNELFSGIGAQTTALKRLGIEHKVVGISDIDKYANQSYMAIHGQTRQYGDICKAERLDYADLWTYSFPCQDLSVAGKQAGIHEGTRSGLLYEVERLLETAVIEGNAPKWLLLENVKNLVGKKFKPDFDKWLDKLNQFGYNNYWKVLNAKDYGVPQNRERVFVVSIRKDIDDGTYTFPEKKPLTRRLKDVLDQQVDEKYYLSDKMVEGFVARIKKEKEKPVDEKRGFAQKINIRDENGFCSTITSRIWKCGCTDPYIVASRGRNPENPSDRTTGCPTEQRLEPNTRGTSNTITTVQKDNYVIVPEATKQGYAKAYEGDSINLEQPNSQTRRDRVGHQIANTLTCSCNQGVVEPKVINPLAGKSEYGWHFEQEVYDEKGIARAVKAGGGSGNIPKIIQEPINLYPNSGNPQAGRVYNTDGISPAMDTCQGGNRMPKIIDDTYANRAPREYEDSCPTIRSERSGLKVQDYRIRKLTPRECWRLMGFTDEEFHLAEASGVSNTQLYKQAGNAIVVDVLVGIFGQLFKGEK